MFDIAAQQVWLAPGTTDMRKSIDGLSALTQYALGQNPLQRRIGLKSPLQDGLQVV